MKQQKLSGYKPNYPKKAIKGMTLAAAALLTIGAATGCRTMRPEPQIDGAIAVDDPTPGIEETLPPETLSPEELQTEGMVPIYEMETPEPLLTTGEPTLPPTEEPMLMGTPAPEQTEEPMLMGDVAVFEP